MKTTDNMANISEDLDILYKLGYKYIFIDEITLLEDFINTASILSNIYGQIGMKIVLSGTDSLGFSMADVDELYDRNIMIHTSYISFKEYSRVLDIDSIDKYIEYGGTLKKENRGKMLEDIVLLEANNSFNQDKKAFKFVFDQLGEYDMVIYDRENNTCEIFEIKHSDKIIENQTKYLLNESMCEIVSSRFGEITNKYVLYTGKDKKVGNIHYLNVEKFLKSL